MRRAIGRSWMWGSAIVLIDSYVVSHAQPYLMLEVDITHTSMTINQLINQVENGEEVMIIRHGKAIARLSAISPIPQPLTSQEELRAAQSQTVISTLLTLQSLRQEARY